MPTTLTPKQKEAIESWENLCVIASAGTGKTTVLIQKFIHVHQTQQIPIQKILAFTFTEKATQEMQERLAKNDLINNENKMLLQISTIHGFCHQLLSQFGYAVNLKSHFSIFNSSAFTLWLKNEIDEWVQENLKNDDVIFNDIIDLYGIADLQNLVKQFTEQNLLYLDPKEIEVVEENSHKKNLLQNFLKKNYEFQRHLLKKRIESQILCYDDLEILTLDILKNHPHILEKIQQRYRFILVDEFQDISKIQFQIISQIFEPKLNKIFIVGDPKQSIYGFRGGAVENFLKMETIIQENNGKTIFLEETFRTPQTIQNFFNTVFPKLYSQTQNNLYQRILSKNDFAESHLYTNLLEETKKEKTKDFMEKTLTDIAIIIKKIIAQNQSPQNIAIIAPSKTYFYLAKKIFTEHNIACDYPYNTSLSEEPVIIFLKTILVYLAQKSQLIDQVCLLKNPFLAFSEQTIEKMINHHDGNLFDDTMLSVLENTEEKLKWLAFKQHLDRWKDLAGILFIDELFIEIVQSDFFELSITDKILAEDFLGIIKSWRGQNYHNLQDIQQLLHYFSETHIPSSVSERQSNAVFLSSVHSVKGLEFDYLFLLPGKQTSPNKQIYLFKSGVGFAFKTPDEANKNSLQFKLTETVNYEKFKNEEEISTQAEIINLIYVAMTRVKKVLFLVSDYPSQKLKKSLEKNPDETKELSSYNNWLYWLHTQIEKNFLQYSELSQKIIQHDEIKNNALPLFEYDQQEFSSAHKNKPNLSVTQLEIFSQCPKKYQLKYLAQIQPFSLNTTNHSNEKNKITAQQKGIFIHEVLQFFDFKTENNFNTVVTQALFNQHLVEFTPQLTTATQELIHTLLNNPTTSALFKNNLTSQEEVEFILKLKDFYLNGKIDKLIHTPDKKWLIVDYKTQQLSTKNKRDLYKKLFDFQMKCYALAVYQEFEQDEMSCFVIMTDNAETFEFTFKREELEKFRNELEDLFLLKGHCEEKNEFSLATDTENCAYCPYFAENYCGIHEFAKNKITPNAFVAQET